MGLNTDTENLSHEAVLRKYELMQAVFGIITRSDLTFAQQIDEILEEGCALFDEDIGIVSRIEGQRYIVEHVYSRDGSIHRGQVFDLATAWAGSRETNSSSSSRMLTSRWP